MNHCWRLLHLVTTPQESCHQQNNSSWELLYREAGNQATLPHSGLIMITHWSTHLHVLYYSIHTSKVEHVFVIQPGKSFVFILDTLQFTVYICSTCIDICCDIAVIACSNQICLYLNTHSWYKRVLHWYQGLKYDGWWNKDVEKKTLQQTNVNMVL